MLVGQLYEAGIVAGSKCIRLFLRCCCELHASEETCSASRHIGRHGSSRVHAALITHRSVSTCAFCCPRPAPRCATLGAAGAPSGSICWLRTPAPHGERTTGTGEGADDESCAAVQLQCCGPADNSCIAVRRQCRFAVLGAAYAWWVSARRKDDWYRGGGFWRGNACAAVRRPSCSA
jgi:hypothetical protein